MMSGGGMGTPRLWLADGRGGIIASTDNSRRGQGAPASELANGTPISVDGARVGTLIADASATNGVVDALSQDLLDQVNRSLLIAGLIAAAIALALGFVIFRQITAPLDALEKATQKIARGDLKARAVVRGSDEISRLGHSFNSMADNLERSETARRNMLADVAHELRNPLGVISSHLEAMLDGVFQITPEQIASLHDETTLLTRLVDDLRDLTLADAGQLSLHRKPADLSALVRRTTEAFQDQAADHGTILQSEIGADLPPLDLGAERIEQVLRNLISNALRYTQAGAEVYVKLMREGSVARVEVKDTGPGIPAQELDHVFERFWRGDKSRARAGGGTGLGLSIAQQWIQAHGGQIGVTSQAGQGTTFWFTLPLGEPG
jgi:signal transduction histidine kinase